MEGLAPLGKGTPLRNILPLEACKECPLRIGEAGWGSQLVGEGGGVLLEEARLEGGEHAALASLEPAG